MDRCTDTVSCDTVMDKAVQPMPTNENGFDPEFEDISGRQFQLIEPESGDWEVKSPYYDMGCNYTNNIDGWVFRFSVNSDFISCWPFVKKMCRDKSKQIVSLES